MKFQISSRISRDKFQLTELHYFAFCILQFAILLFPLHSYGDIEKTIKNLEEKQKEIETWEADFIQTKVISLMASKISSEGHTAFKRPNLVHWRYTGGSNLLMVFDGKDAWLYYPNLKEAERYKNIERIISKFPLAYGLDIKNLSKYWDITIMPASSNGLISLELRPKGKDEKKIFDKMTLWVEESRGVPRKVQIFEPGGDNTIIEFKGVRINERLPVDIFTFKPPAGVKVISPLEER